MLQPNASRLGIGETAPGPQVAPFKRQLLKWIGSKQKFAHEIIGYFPSSFGTYHEPFLGAGGVLAALRPDIGFGSDSFAPLIEIWTELAERPNSLKRWYADRWAVWASGDPKDGYEEIKRSYNARPNGPDLLFLCRACYGGVVRFRKSDGYMSTPVGPHTPISPDSFSDRVDAWHPRVAGTTFAHLDFEEAMLRAKPGDLVYCDPPYSFSQTILYGAQDFTLARLMRAIQSCKNRGVMVALSIDGTKKSGDTYCDIPLPPGLFEREVFVNLGPSMLKRFQSAGKTLEAEVVRDRLLLTY